MNPKELDDAIETVEMHQQEYGDLDGALAILREIARIAAQDVAASVAEGCVTIEKRHDGKLELKRYPRILDCHPREVASMRREMFVEGYLTAKGVDSVDEMRSLRPEAIQAFDDFSAAMSRLNDAMVRTDDARSRLNGGSVVSGCPICGRHEPHVHGNDRGDVTITHTQDPKPR